MEATSSRGFQDTLAHVQYDTVQHADEKVCVSLAVPRSWQELGRRQMEFVFKLLARELSATEIKIMLLLRWNNIEVLQKDSDGGGVSCYVLKHNRQVFMLTTERLAELTLYLNWMDELPSAPVRLERLSGHKALPADFAGVPFETLLIIDNFYQGYLRTNDDTLLDEIGQVLYNWDGHSFLPWQRVAIFYWVASLKDYLARKFPTLFKPADSTSLAPTSVEEAMNIQIRALTKGDITKEHDVLAMDCYRALAELEAQAKEYEELKRKYK